MKYYFFMLVCFFLLKAHGFSQIPAETVAAKIAQKMKDSLALTDEQKSQVYTINMNLHSQKMLKRQQYTALDSLSIHMQRVENTRDSLYQLVLTSEQFLLYRTKKTNLVNNN